MPQSSPHGFGPPFLTKKNQKFSWKETCGRGERGTIVRTAQKREGFKAWPRFLGWLKAKFRIYVFSFPGWHFISPSSSTSSSPRGGQAEETTHKTRPHQYPGEEARPPLSHYSLVPSPEMGNHRRTAGRRGVGVETSGDQGVWCVLPALHPLDSLSTKQVLNEEPTSSCPRSTDSLHQRSPEQPAKSGGHQGWLCAVTELTDRGGASRLRHTPRPGPPTGQSSW